MKKGKLFIGFLIVALIVPVALIFAQQQMQRERAPQQRHQGQRMEMHGTMGLDLSEAQQEKIKELHLKTQKEAIQPNNQLNENRAKMRTLSTADKPDMKAINSLIDESAKVQADLQKMRAANHQEVRAMLTDEQRIIFDSNPRRDQMMRHRTQGRSGAEGRMGARRRMRMAPDN